MGKHFYQNVLEKFQLLTFFVRKNIPILSEVDENEHEKSNGLFIAELAENSHVDVDFFFFTFWFICEPNSVFESSGKTRAKNH